MSPQRTTRQAASSESTSAILVMPSGAGTEEDDDLVHILQDVELQLANSPLRKFKQISLMDKENDMSSSSSLSLPSLSLLEKSSKSIIVMEESTFGASEVPNTSEEDSSLMGDEELVNVSPLKSSGGVGRIAAKISLHSDLADAPAGFDVCKEYGYKYEYTQEVESDSDDDEEDDGRSNNLRNSTTNPESQSFLSKLSAAITTDDDDNIIDSNNPQNINYTIHLAGKSYHPIHDYATRREDESNLFWFTYRCDFPPLNPYNLTSDAGWGCMLRSAQMMLVQALRMHYVGRGYKPAKSTVQRRSQMFLQDLFMWMADFPSANTTGCYFSLHNMVAVGMARYETLPGEWFGPGTACYVMRDLVERQEMMWRGKYGQAAKDKAALDKKVKNKKNKDGEYKRDFPPMRVYVAPEGCIYRQEVHGLMTKDSSSTPETQQNGGNPVTHNESSTNLMDDPLSHPLSINPTEEKSTIETPEWDTAALILIPLRLGLKEFNASSYSIPLAHSFSLPQSVGFIGGSPRHALWFYAAHSDGKKLYGLDPHTVQKSPRRRKLKPNEVTRTGNSKKYQVLLSDEYLRSVNCPNPSSMGMHRIDPSLALGFYCRDKQDFESLCLAVEGMKSNKKMKDFPALFSIADAKPDYTADVSSAMLDLMMGSSSQLDCDGDEIENDDDDDFVLL